MSTELRTGSAVPVPNATIYGPSESYYDITKSRPTSSVLEAAVELIGCTSDLPALDLGCGAGVDTRFLLEQGCQVTAVDGSDTARERIEALGADNERHQPKFICSGFEAFDFETVLGYGLVNASRSLPFAHPEAFRGVVARMFNAMRPGGIFAGHFYGINDEWNVPPHTMTFLSRREVEKIVRAQGARLLELDETDGPGKIANGTPKNWHLFNVVAEKPA